MRYAFVRPTPTFEERAQGVLSTLKSDASKAKDLDRAAQKGPHLLWI